ncbi:MAG: hypothetical protein U0354_20955 [Candidatus Sericytochromatia bacterium]
MNREEFKQKLLNKAHHTKRLKEISYEKSHKIKLGKIEIIEDEVLADEIISKIRTFE